MNTTTVTDMEHDEQRNDDLNDDDRPSNTLELFVELNDILEMIDDVKECNSRVFEKEYQKFTEVLTRYQEQPHLLDPHLELLINKLLSIVRNKTNSVYLMHASFKYLYVITKVRTYKAIVKFFPHELDDLEFALDLLEQQNPNDSEYWETRYILLLWMSILVLNPFDMARLDSYACYSQVSTAGAVGTVCDEMGIINAQKKTKMQRIFDMCKLYTNNDDTCCIVAAFLSAKFLIRRDAKEIYLPKYLQWIMGESTNNDDGEDQNIGLVRIIRSGQLAAIALILKYGKREDLLQYADMLLKWTLQMDYKNGTDFLKHKFFIKIIQRIGLVYLKPRIATWRYKRGSRSLTSNLLQFEQKTDKEDDRKQGNFTDQEDENITVPDTVEEVIEELLQGLRSASSDVRWNAAKGLGRVANRLSKTLGDEVIGSVIDILNPLEPHEAWHGACLAVAELAKHNLLLPQRLKDMVPLLMKALFYDEMKGYMSVGQHIRDSACYVCWAFARAYESKDIQPFITQIASGLLIVAAFDREINCRRAASAAFQESVGRLGNFPHGIEILTTTDFFTVGLRTNSYLHISDFIAQFDEYKKPLIDHLIEKKINHWDISLRELSSKALYKLTKRAPHYMADSVLPKLFAKTDSIDINTRHGSVLAIGEIVLALKELELSAEEQCPKKNLITNQIENDLNELIIKFFKRELFRGISGDIMKQCCTKFISNCSKAKIKANSDCLESWQELIDKSLINKNAQIRDLAAEALKLLCESYYNDNNERINEKCSIIDNYLTGSENDLEEHVRIGYLNAIGALPKFIIKLKLENVLNTLIKHSLPPHHHRGEMMTVFGNKTCNNNTSNTPAAQKVNTTQQQQENPITFSWSEARRDSVKALSSVVQTIGFDKNDSDFISNPQYLTDVFDCFIEALGEYTLDNRGDIGAWVREAALQALYQLLIICPHELLTPNLVHQIINGFAQQAVEKIDRTRGLAGKLFCKLIYHEPIIPYIQRHNELLKIFPEDHSKILWLFADRTFPLFCKMLEFPEYSERLILGISASMGQLTESLIKYTSASFFEFLRSHPNHIHRICNEIIMVFEQNLLNERVTYPMLNFLNLLISSGTINAVLVDETSKFPDEVFRLVTIEIKGHKKLYKLISSISVYCQLIQVSRLSTKILSKMSLFLGFTHVHIRKTTATKLYEALVLYSECCTTIVDENLDEILNILSETDWGCTLDEIRPIRNKLCCLMGIKVPISGGGKITTGNSNSGTST